MERMMRKMRSRMGWTGMRMMVSSWKSILGVKSILPVIFLHPDDDDDGDDVVDVDDEEDDDDDDDEDPDDDDENEEEVVGLEYLQKSGLEVSGHFHILKLVYVVSPCDCLWSLLDSYQFVFFCS